jgi:ribosomal protein L40E
MGLTRRLGPEICSRCGGTGRGEELADLGESLTNATKECRRCSGTGQIKPRTVPTRLSITLCLLLLGLITMLIYEAVLRYPGR